MAMSGELLVTFEVLESTASELQGINSSMRSQTDGIVQLVESTRSFYEGQAADAYIAKVTGLKPDMEKIHGMIDEHVKDLNEMAQNYRRAEDANVKATENLKNGFIS